MTDRASVAQLWSRQDRLGSHEVALLSQVGQRVLLLFYEADRQRWSSQTCLERLPLHLDSLFWQAQPADRILRSPIHLVCTEDGSVMITEMTGMTVLVDNDAFLRRNASFLPIDATHCFLHFLASAHHSWSHAAAAHRDDPRAFFARLSSHAFPSAKRVSLTSCVSCQGAARCHDVLSPVATRRWREIMSDAPKTDHSTRPTIDVTAWNALVDLLPEAVADRVLTQWSTVPLSEQFLSTCQQILHEAVPFHRVPMKTLRCGLLAWKMAAQSIHRRLWEVAPFGLWLALFQIDFGDPPEARPDLANVSGVWISTVAADKSRFAPFASPDDAAVFGMTHPALRAVP